MTVASLAGGVTGLSARWLLMAVERAQSVAAVVVGIDRDAFVARLFEQEGASLVRMARLFTDDRNAAEDLVQEAFIRLHKSAHRIRSPEKAAPYLRSIVINLARDHNRRVILTHLKTGSSSMRSRRSWSMRCGRCLPGNGTAFFSVSTSSCRSGRSPTRWAFHPTR